MRAADRDRLARQLRPPDASLSIPISSGGGRGGRGAPSEPPALRGTFETLIPGRRLHRYTYAEYVALERESPTKHEFLDGEIYAMAGGSEEHSALAAEVLRVLGNALASGDRPCRVHTSDLRVYVEATGLATFPDGAVVCGPLEQHSPSPDATALNPMVLLEVTRDSSEEYDTGGKLEMYRTIPSLRDYVIVSHRERRITVHHRDDRGEWSTRVAIGAGRVLVESVGATLVVDEIYRRSSIA
jgi:Uma2 family endonuclease